MSEISEIVISGKLDPFPMEMDRVNYIIIIPQQEYFELKFLGSLEDKDLIVSKLLFYPSTDLLLKIRPKYPLFSIRGRSLESLRFPIEALDTVFILIEILTNRKICRIEVENKTDLQEYWQFFKLIK